MQRNEQATQGDDAGGFGQRVFLINCGDQLSKKRAKGDCQGTVVPRRAARAGPARACRAGAVDCAIEPADLQCLIRALPVIR